MSGPNPIADRQTATEARHASPLERCAGLVFGYLFHGGAGKRVNDDTLSHHLGHAHDWTWLHLALADHRARRFLESFGEMPKAARELMLTPEDRVQLHLTPTGPMGFCRISSATSPIIPWARGGWLSGSTAPIW